MALREKEIQEILESGLLESYALGLTDASEEERVSSALEESAELRAEFEAIQKSIETLAISGATTAPAGLKGRIMDAIQGSTKETESDSNPGVQSGAQRDTVTTQSNQTAVIKRMNRMVVAASVAAFLFAAVAVSEWIRATKFQDQNQLLTEQMELLRRELSGEQLKFATLEETFDAINDPQTGKYTLLGGEKAPSFAAVAYWNDEDQTSYLRVVNHPELENDEVLQLWADVHGEMVSLGVIENTTDIVALDFKVDAESLNVTIEPEGGSEHPTVSRLVASVVI